MSTFSLDARSPVDPTSNPAADSAMSPTPQAPAASDILIVGAGPAGATLSLFLAQAKVPHTLVDSATFPRDKADGNVQGTKVIEVLNSLSPAYLPELMARTDQFLGCDTAQIFTPNGNRFNLRFPHSGDVPCFTMNRRDFDAFLVEKLDSRYAHQQFGTSLKSIEKKTAEKKADIRRWQVTLEAEGKITELSPQLIVAADGANSSVLREMNIQLPKERYYDTVQGYFRGVTGFAEDSFETDDFEADSSKEATSRPRADGQVSGQYFHFEGHFLPESTPGFFFVVPLANNIYNVGVGKPRTDVEQQNVDLFKLLHEIMHSHPQFSERFAQAELVSDIRPWPLIAGATDQASISGDGYLAVGDAAGLCTPLTYFGTGNAMISGMLAAEQIQRAVSQQSFNADTLKAYDRAVYARLQTEFQAANLTRSFIKRNWLFNLVSSNAPIKSVLRRSLKKTSTMLKKL